MSGDLFDSAPLDFVCPRCSLPTSGPFYGPCEMCRDALRASQDGEARGVNMDATMTSRIEIEEPTS